MRCSLNDIRALNKDFLTLFLKFKEECLTCTEAEYSKGLQDGAGAEAMFNPSKDH